MHSHRRTHDNQLAHVSRIASHARVPKPSESTVSGHPIRLPCGACMYICGCLDRLRKQKGGGKRHPCPPQDLRCSAPEKKTKTLRTSMVLLFIFDASWPRCACAGAGSKVRLNSLPICLCASTLKSLHTSP